MKYILSSADKADLIASLARLTACGGLFYRTFYEEFIAADRRIKQLMSDTDSSRRQRILAQSLTYTVLGADGVTAPQELRKLIDSHGPNGLNISADMMMKWRGALLRAVEKHDPEYNDNVEHIWGTAALHLIEHFQPPDA